MFFNFAQIISGKLIHDFASLSSVIENSTQMLIDKEDEDFAKQILQSTSKKLVDRIKFYKVCFSKKNEDVTTKKTELIQIIKNYFQGSKISINLSSFEEQLKPEISQINTGFITNALMMFASLIAQNGYIEIEASNNNITFSSNAKNILNEEIKQSLNGNTKEINEHNIHYSFFYHYTQKYNLIFSLTEKDILKLTLQLA